MRFWLFHAGEPLHIDPGTERLLRVGLLANLLAERGHEVVWWTSSFDHTHKRQRYETTTDVPVGERLTLRLLYAAPYYRNISLARLRNHRALAREFARCAPGALPPDVALACLPTLEIAAAALRWARARGIPTVADVRDQHPDIYAQLAPAPLRPLARLALLPLERDLRVALRNADAVYAISERLLAWGLGKIGRRRSALDHVFPLAYPELTVTAAERARAEHALRAQGVDPTKHIVWYIGTFNRWIDLGPVLHAARAFHAAGDSSILFVLSGNGDYDQRWRRRSADLPNVRFTGWIGPPSISVLRDWAWVGIAPYRPSFPVVGNKVIEYLAGGLPVLASRSVAARDLAARHDAIMTYDQQAGSTLRERLGELLAAPALRNARARNARRAYQEGYDARHVYGTMIDSLEDLARR